MKINSKIIVLVIATLCAANSYGQNVHTKKMPAKPKEKKVEQKNTLELGGGIMSSVVYLSRNVNEGNDARGWTVIANYGDDRYFRVSLQFTKYFPIDIAPTWYDINATTAEFNLEKMVLFKNNKTILYPFIGLSYNTFKGYFTGFNDYLNLREKYAVNAVASTKWVGLNLGTGVEHSFGRIVIFMDYKMRVGQIEKPFGITIMDVCYSGGVRVKLHVPTLRKLYRGVNDKYHWF